IAVHDPTEAQAHTAHVETRGVTLDRNSGLVETDQAVRFLFPTGRGEAVGLEYSSERGTLRLLKGVRLGLWRAGKTGRANRSETPQEVHIRGTGLAFDRGPRFLQFQGPVLAETVAQRLTTGEMSLAFDEQFRAKKLVATAGIRGGRPMA